MTYRATIIMQTTYIGYEDDATEGDEGDWLHSVNVHLYDGARRVVVTFEHTERDDTIGIREIGARDDYTGPDVPDMLAAAIAALDARGITNPAIPRADA